MNKCITFLVFIFATSIASAQNNWSTLAMVTFENKYDPEFGMETKKPTVSPMVKMLEATEMEIEGYIIPLNGKLEQNHFMLSKFTQNMCFFCGKAGPETAMQVFLANGKKIPYTENKVRVKGILRINEHDMSGLLYTLDNAIILK